LERCLQFLSLFYVVDTCKRFGSWDLISDKVWKIVLSAVDEMFGTWNVDF
jgi:hypothetical protein